MPAGEQPGALRDRGLDLAVDAVEQVLPRHRPDVGAQRLGVADAQLRHLGDQQPGELLDDRGVDDEPLRRDAALPGVEEPAAGRHGGDARQVGVGEDDERIGATELEHRLLDGVAGGQASRPPGALAAGDGDRADARVVDQPSGDGGDVRLGDDEGREQPSGAPAAASTRSTASAQPVVFGECLSSAALPAIGAGAANHAPTCQSGKFHGMTASTAPTVRSRSSCGRPRWPPARRRGSRRRARRSSRTPSRTSPPRRRPRPAACPSRG